MSRNIAHILVLQLTGPRGSRDDLGLARGGDKVALRVEFGLVLGSRLATARWTFAAVEDIE